MTNELNESSLDNSFSLALMVALSQMGGGGKGVIFLFLRWPSKVWHLDFLPVPEAVSSLKLFSVAPELILAASAAAWMQL